MDSKQTLIFASSLLILCCTSVYAQKGGSVISSPAPAPAPDYVNLNQLFTLDGPYIRFRNYLESTKVLDTFQNQANNSQNGITIFAPTDVAFSSLKYPSLTNISNDQLKSLLLFHALPHFYTLSDFNNLSQISPVATLAGGQYTLNFTDVSGTVIVNSGWSNTTISSAVHSSYPVSVFQVDEVLLPETIFGTKIPPPPPPSPVAPPPVTTPAADAPSGGGGGATKPSSKPGTQSSSSVRARSFGVLCYSVLLVFGGVVFMSI